MDAQNEPGVFLGFDHLNNMFGVVILVKQSLVVVRHNVTLVESSKKRNPVSHNRIHLTSSLDGKNDATEVHDFDHL